MTIDPRLERIVAAQPYPLLFATISGAHLYGFPSPDSDFDLRGAHVLPLDAVVGLEVRDETVEDSRIIEGLACRAKAESEVESASTSELRRDSLRPDVIGSGPRLEMDIVSHDVRKFFGLLLKKNGYVLEQLFSPLIVHTTPEHAELKAICNPRQMKAEKSNNTGRIRVRP
jgi:predicted nucleotidyltransferase